MFTLGSINVDSAALELAGNLLHYRVAGFVSGARRKGLLMCHDGTRSFVQAQQLPADRFVARATAEQLPSCRRAPSNVRWGVTKVKWPIIPCASAIR
jgi:hypothetical protein